MIEITGRINQVREDLIDTRRYARTSVVHTRSGLTAARVMLHEMAVQLEQALWAEPQRESHLNTLERLVANLAVADKFVQVAPAMTTGYIDGAVFELGRLKSTLERGETDTPAPAAWLPEANADGCYRYADGAMVDKSHQKPGQWIARKPGGDHFSCGQDDCIVRHGTPEQAAAHLASHGYGPAVCTKPEAHDPAVCRCPTCDGRRVQFTSKRQEPATATYADTWAPIPASTVAMASPCPIAAAWVVRDDDEASLAIAAHAATDDDDAANGPVS